MVEMLVVMVLVVLVVVRVLIVVLVVKGNYVNMHCSVQVMSLPRCGVADKGGRSSPLLQVNSSIAGEYNLQGSRWQEMGQEKERDIEKEKGSRWGFRKKCDRDANADADVDMCSGGRRNC